MGGNSVSVSVIFILCQAYIQCFCSCQDLEKLYFSHLPNFLPFPSFSTSLETVIAQDRMQITKLQSFTYL